VIFFSPQRRKDRKGRKVEDELSKVVVDSAIAVHRVLGPGLLESTYTSAMEIELGSRGIPFEAEWPVSASYAGRPLGVAYRADLLVAGKVLVELKSVAAIEPIHTAQLLTYLRLANLKLGLLLNFNTPLMKDGMRRVVNGL
jgi:GxxExxY protein